MCRAAWIILFCSAFGASATEIRLIDATYSVELTNLIRLEKPATVVTKNVTSAAPINESLSELLDPLFGEPLVADGIADTSALFIHTVGPSDDSVAEALARTDLLFSPIADELTTIDFSWVARSDFAYIGGLFSLVDVTAGLEIDALAWEMAGGMPRPSRGLNLGRRNIFHRCAQCIRCLSTRFSNVERREPRRANNERDHVGARNLVSSRARYDLAVRVSTRCAYWYS